MKASFGMFVCLVACAVVASPFSATTATAISPSQAPAIAGTDKALDERIEQRLRDDPTLKNHDIKVSVDAGVATLTGTVSSNAEKARAARLATIRGVSRVDNRIVVDRSTGKQGTTGKVEQTAKEGAQKAKEGAEKVVDKT